MALSVSRSVDSAPLFLARCGAVDTSSSSGHISLLLPPVECPYRPSSAMKLPALSSLAAFAAATGGISGCPALPKNLAGPCWWKPNPDEVHIRRDVSLTAQTGADHKVSGSPPAVGADALCGFKCSQLNYCCWEFHDGNCQCTIHQGLGEAMCKRCRSGPPRELPPQPTLL